MNVDCVCRVTYKGEIIPTTFNTETGKIRGLESVYDIKLDSRLAWFVNNYIEPNFTLTQHDLVVMMCKNRECLAVINYNQIGYVIVYKDRAELKLEVDPPSVLRGSYKIPDIMLFSEKSMRVLGPRKTVLHTLQVLQPYAWVVAIRGADGIERVYTPIGVLDVQKGLSPYESVDKVLYHQMCRDDFSFGIGNYRGKNVLLREEDGTIVYR